jgi:hypothetical protein
MKQPRLAASPSGRQTCLIITASGSYYLTEHIEFAGETHGITITANNVTLDLNGFALIGPGRDVGGSASGIRLHNGATPVDSAVVYNGVIREWPGNGIGWDTMISVRCRVSAVTIDRVGLSGILAGNSSIVEDCHVSNALASGALLGDRSTIRRTVVHSIGNSTSNVGIRVGGRSLVSECSALTVTGTGFDPFGADIRFEDCHAYACFVGGFGSASSLTGIQFLRCVAANSGGSGFRAGLQGQFIECTSRSNALHGIELVGSGSSGIRIEACVIDANGLDGISGTLGTRGTVLNSQVSSNGNDGVDLGSNWLVSGNRIQMNGGATGFTTGAGIRVTSGGTVRDNTVDSNDIGIAATQATNYFAANTLRANTTAKSLAGSTEGTGDLSNPVF